MNKTYKHLASLVFDEPHLCTISYAETILAVLEDRLGIEEGLFSIQQGKAREAPEALVGNGTKVIPIIGSMTHRGSMMDAMSGVQSYQAIKDKIAEAMSDNSVKSILLDMDSPGGSVAGAFDLRDYVMSLRGQKPIIALSQDTMASAAYLIGSAADKVYTTQTGSVGSIGVVAMHVDRSAKNKAEGIKPTFIYAGDYKTAGNPNEALQGEALEYLQESVNDSYEMFVNAVAEARGIDPTDVRATEARMYRGEKATAIGLSDGVMSFDAAIEELARMSAPAGSVSMQKGFPLKPKANTKGMKMTPEEMEQMAADLAAKTKENETLRGYLLSEGYSLTKDGIEKAAAINYIEVAGEKVDRATLPAAVVTALETAAQEKMDAEVTALAATEFPNFSLSDAKALVTVAKGNEALMAALKGADAALAQKFEETGSSDVDGTFQTAQDKLDALVAVELAASGKTGTAAKQLAFAKVVKTAEGAKLEAQARKEQ